LKECLHKSCEWFKKAVTAGAKHRLRDLREFAVRAVSAICRITRSSVSAAAAYAAIRVLLLCFRLLLLLNDAFLFHSLLFQFVCRGHSRITRNEKAIVSASSGPADER
jgi:hypothetical protein